MRTFAEKERQPQQKSSTNLTRPITIQPKLAASTPGDIYEQEADRLAEHVTHGEGCATKHAGASDSAQITVPSNVNDVLASAGQPLDTETRAFMEPRLGGHDFSRVRVHADGQAAESAQSVNSFAYTVGNHIVFGKEQYSPSSASGRHLLAHELVHVTQQQAATPQLQRQPVDRPGAKWPFGPITKHKVAVVKLPKYISWVNEVERYVGPDKQTVLQRLRRLYYSKYSGAAGAEFDLVIAEQAGAGSGPPLTTQMISAAALDGLYETNQVELKDGSLVDVSHVLAGLDLKTSGITFKAAGAEAVYNVSWLGIVTWAGDLASWFVKWLTNTEASPTPPALQAAQKVALLSDMDGQVLAASEVRPSTPESVKAERRVVRDKNIGTELSMPVSVLLDWYYGAGMEREQVFKAIRRFTEFVRVASPPIPHSVAKDGTVTLAADAEDAIYKTIRRTARLMILQGKHSFGEEVLDMHDKQLRLMAQRFVRFLNSGMATGDGTW